MTHDTLADDPQQHQQYQHQTHSTTHSIDAEENPFDPHATHQPIEAFEPVLTKHDEEYEASPGSSASPPAANDSTTQLIAPTQTHSHSNGISAAASTNTSISSDENPFDSSSSLPHLLALEVSAPDATTQDKFAAVEEPPFTVKSEFRAILNLAIPAVLMNLLFVSMGTGSQMLVGHISSEALAAAVCGTMIHNMSFFFTYGFAGALDTLAAQSYGAGSIHGVNLWTKRAIFLCTILIIPTALPVFFSYDIMHSILGQSEEVSAAAQNYCRWMVAGMWPFAMTLVLQKYLATQGIMQPTIWIALFANVVNIILEAILIWPVGWGLEGGAIGMIVARWLQFVVTAWYCHGFQQRQEAERVARAADEERLAALTIAEREVLATITESGDMLNGHNGLTSAIEIDTVEDGTSPGAVASPSRLATLRQSSTRFITSGARAVHNGVKNSASAVTGVARGSIRQVRAGAVQAAKYARNPKTLAKDMRTLQKESMEGVWNWTALKLFIALGVPSGLMSGLECWAFESTGIMATRLPLDQLDAHYVLLNLTMITYFTFPVGISIAASIRVGNLVGAGHIKTARLTTKLVACCGAGFMVVSGICIASSRTVIGYLFSNDEAVVTQVARIAPIGGLFQVFDGVQGSVGGVLRGLGMQREAAVSNLLGMCLCGALVAYLIAFQADMGLPGLWWGLAIGLFVTMLANGFHLYRTDWDKKVAEARERIRKDEEEYAKRRAEILEEATRGQPIGDYAADYQNEIKEGRVPEL